MARRTLNDVRVCMLDAPASSFLSSSNEEAPSVTPTSFALGSIATSRSSLSQELPARTSRPTQRAKRSISRPATIGYTFEILTSYRDADKPLHIAQAWPFTQHRGEASQSSTVSQHTASRPSPNVCGKARANLFITSALRSSGPPVRARTNVSLIPISIPISMNGQNGWYAGQQSPNSPYGASPGQLPYPQQQQFFPPLQQQQAGSSQPYPQQMSPVYQNSHAPGTHQSPYAGMTTMDPPQRYQSAAGPSQGSPFTTHGMYPQSTNGTYNLSPVPQHSSNAGFSAGMSRGDGTGPTFDSSRVQLHNFGPPGQGPSNSHHEHQQQPQQQYNGNFMPAAGTSYVQRQSTDYGHMASPVQQSFQSSAGPSHHQQHIVAPPSAALNSTPRHDLQPQHANSYNSPYAPSTGTRERLAMSQSPMSDMFQSGGQSMGKTFNLMAGLETPTPNANLRRVSAQSQFEGRYNDDLSGSPAQSMPAPNLSTANYFNTASSSSGQHFAPWPAVQRTSQGDASLSSLSSWDQSKPYSNMQPNQASSRSNALAHPQAQRFSIDSPSHLPSGTRPPLPNTLNASINTSDRSAAPRASAHPPSLYTGSSLDIAWGVSPSHASPSSQAPNSGHSMGQTHHMPHLTEPGSPSLSVARKHSSSSRQPSQLPSLPSSSGSATLDSAMSSSSHSVQPKQSNAYPATSAQLIPVKRGPKTKRTSEVGSAASSDPSRPMLPPPDVALGSASLPQYASPSQIFSRPTAVAGSAAMPPPSPSFSAEPLRLRRSEEPRTPPLRAAHTLSIQESPDPLNFLPSPDGQYSLWQHPGSSSLPPQPAFTNGASYQQFAPQHQADIMAITRAANNALPAKRKDSATADQPKKKRVKKVKDEQTSRAPTFDLHVPESPSTSSQGGLTTTQPKPALKLKKKNKKALAPAKYDDDDDEHMLPQVTVEIPLMVGNEYAAQTSYRSKASEPSWAPSGQIESDKKRKKKKRSRKSLSELVNQIVEDSDSGIDAEGSDCDWEGLEIVDTFHPQPTPEGPKSLAKMSSGPVKSSQRKVPIAKLCGLIEDLFEADDSLPDRDSLQDLLPGQSLSSAADQFFEIIESPSVAGGESRSVLVLRTAALQRLIKYIALCSRHHTEIASMSGKAQAAANPSLSTIPAADIIRLLSILERTVRVGENIDPFPSQGNRAMASEPASPTKQKKGRKGDRRGKSTSKTPEPVYSPDYHDADEQEGAEHSPKEAERDQNQGAAKRGSADEELEKLNATFAITDRALLAAECSLGMLTGDVLPKQILSEDLIRASFDAVKLSLDKVILPFIEACSGSAATAPHANLVLLIDVLAPQKARKKKAAAAANADETPSSIGIICRNTLSDLFAHLRSALFLVQRMVRMPSLSLSDSIVISAVYLALGPFFVLEPETAGGGASSETAKASARGRSAMLSLGGANSMKMLRLPALNLLRSIFAKAPDQRQWMIEEILTSLTKLTDMKKNRRQYSLRNGKGIHSINALLLQLIQAASHGVADYARSAADRLSRAKESQDEEGEEAQDERNAETGGGQVLEVVIEAFNATSEPDSHDAREAENAVWRRGLEGASASARSIAGYLMQRIGQNKVAKSSQEMSHAYVIESLIQDLLSALYLPEWPAAALMLSAFCRVFGNYLEDPKSHPDAKGVALEQLSLVAARLRQSQLQLQLANADVPVSPTERRQSGAEDVAGEHNQKPALKPEPRSPGKRAKWSSWDYLSMLRALRDGDRTAVREYVRAYKFIYQFLAKSSSEDLSTEGALEFMLVQAEGELATTWAKAEEDMIALDQSEDDSAVQIEVLKYFRKELETAMVTLSELQPVISDASFDVFTSDEKLLDKATDFSERTLIANSSTIAYSTLRDLLVEGLNNPLIANRSKALRGIDRIAQVDPDLLDEDSMRGAIVTRLKDSSNAVRDSAVALFGNYLLRKPQHIPKYYKQLAARVLDTGLSVRKRMVRLLKSLYEATDDPKIRIDACARIVRCINDEDTVVQDMAALTIGEMWLDMDIDTRRLYTRRRGSPFRSDATPSQPADASEAKEEPQASEEATAPGDDVRPMDSGSLGETEVDRRVADTVETIMAVADVIKERPSPLEEVFRRLFKDKSESEAAELHAKLQKLGDSMIDSLVESSGASSIDTVKRIRIVQLLVSTNPAILTIPKAKLLLPYLKAAQTGEEVQIMDLLLRIFRSCLPHMPKTALAFAASLENSLRPLVNRPPPKAGLHLLQELIACYCSVIITHTHNFRLLIQTLRACFTRVQQMRQLALKGQKVEDIKAWSTLMSLTASLCEHAEFDEIRRKYVETAPDIDAISKRPLVDVVSEALLDIHKSGSETVRSVALQNLGFIFRAHPTLMTRPSLTAMMDDIFKSGSLQDRATLLKIILDFLSADSMRRNPDNAVVTAGTGRRKPENPDAGSVDMTILVGNTETFADTGVGSAMMQRYSEDVLKATLEVSNPPLQRTAIDILRFTVLQGLSHPIQCVPYLVSLETLEDRKFRSRAMELHSHLASKHASLVHARFLDTARSAFRFQLQLSGPQALRGYRVDNMPTAVLGAWYSLLRDRRATRLDFLKQIVKALDVNTAASDCDMEEVLFARFMADNLATLDYKTMEELFIVIGELRSILAVSGMQVLYMMQSHLPKQDASAASAPIESLQDGMRTPPPGVAMAGSDLISPLAMSRNPWLSGEWQLQLASDAPPPFAGTVDPTQIFGLPQQPMVQASNDASTDVNAGRDHDEGEAGPSAQVDPITVAKMSVIAATTLLLRNHLKHLYGLSEARCAKFNPSKKQSAGADKPATMRALSDPMQAALDLSVMPFGLEEVKTEEDAQKQIVAYAAMVENEGTMMEPEDPDAYDDLAL